MAPRLGQAGRQRLGHPLRHCTAVGWRLGQAPCRRGREEAGEAPAPGPGRGPASGVVMRPAPNSSSPDSGWLDSL
jgi:hypothetical protein